MGKLKKVCLVIGLVIIFIFLYCYGAVRHSKRVNTDMTTTDQSAYMLYAKRMYGTKYTYIADGARMPVYPFLQSLFYNSGMSDQEFFLQGKYFNIILSLIILLYLFLIFQKYFNLLHAINITLITAFTVFIFKAAYFQAELLFWFLSFCSFLLMCKMLINPTWKLGVITGVIVGMAHLTKASILPGLILFLLFSIVRVTYMFYIRLANKVHISFLSQNRRAFISQLLGVGLVILIFLGTVYPYIRTSKRIFGSYFYNVNSTFYMWYDSWQEVKRGTRAHGDRVGWPDMPPELIPGPRKYFQEHSAEQVVNRISSGLKVMNRNSRRSYGYYKYVLIYFTFFLVIIILNFRQSIKIVTKYFFLLLFCLSYFIVYLLLYAWFVPIIPGNRLILALFIPFMFSTSSVICMHPSRCLSINFLGIKVKLLNILNMFIFCIVVFDMYSVLTKKILAMYGGN